MNYSETYFELDSEEATHCHHCHLISCVYIKGHVSIHCTKDQSNACMCENDVEGVERSLNSLIVTHVTQVERVEGGVCGFYTTLHTELLNLLLMSKGSKVYSVYSGLSPLPGGKAVVWAFRLGGLAVHHWSVQGGSFVNFLGLVNYKGDCRQDAQPIPNS